MQRYFRAIVTKCVIESKLDIPLPERRWKFWRIYRSTRNPRCWTTNVSYQYSIPTTLVILSNHRNSNRDKFIEDTFERLSGSDAPYKLRYLTSTIAWHLCIAWNLKLHCINRTIASTGVPLPLSFPNIITSNYSNYIMRYIFASDLAYITRLLNYFLYLATKTLWRLKSSCRVFLNWVWELTCTRTLRINSVHWEDLTIDYLVNMRKVIEVKV